MKKNTLNIEQQIGELLKKSHSTLSVAESCTGGNISHRLTLVSGASKYYLGSVTSYAICIKEKVLGVDSKVIEKYGVVSNEVAQAMAEGVKSLMGSTYSVATTGLAGPGGDGANAEGTVCIAVSGPEETISARYVFSNNERSKNIELFTEAALQLLYSYIIKDYRTSNDTLPNTLSEDDPT